MLKRFAPKLGLGTLGIAGMMALASDVRAIDQSTPAIAGRAWLPGEAGCFSTPSFSNRVTNTACAGSRSWLVPITTNRFVVGISVNHTIRASSAGAGAAPQCRFVMRNASDSSGSLGGLVSVGTLSLLGSPLVTPSSGETLHVDCTLAQNGRGLTSVNWFVPQ
ncbi:MAG TPA: hypothetical protein VIM73_04000 [Polyangiaceae bacterium]